MSLVDQATQTAAFLHADTERGHQRVYRSTQPSCSKTPVAPRLHLCRSVYNPHSVSCHNASHQTYQIMSYHEHAIDAFMTWEWFVPHAHKPMLPLTRSHILTTSLPTMPRCRSDVFTDIRCARTSFFSRGVTSGDHTPARTSVLRGAQGQTG